jgi:hypothetical protein
MNGWVEPRLQTAIKNGVVSPSGRVNAQCPTGNCTLEKECSTVGYCSSCTDITEHLSINLTIVQSNYTNIVPAKFLNPNGTDTNENLTEPGILSNTNISVSTSLPSGLSVSTSPGTKFNLTAMQVFQQPNGSDDFYRVEIIVGKQFQLFDAATGKPPTGCHTAATNDTWYCDGFAAASCTLSPCVRTYISVIEAGELHETRVSTNNNTRGSWGHTVLPSPVTPSTKLPQVYIPYLGIVDTKCVSASERQSLLDAGYHIDSRTRWLAYNLTFDPQYQDVSNNILQNFTSNASFPESMPVNGCIYALDKHFMSALWEAYLKGFFQGTVKGDAGNGNISAGTIEVLRGPQILQTIYNYGDVSFNRVNSTFQNISDSMTIFFRQNSFSKYSNPAKRVVMHDQTCLSVRWAWLAFPSILVLLTLIFFIVFPL